MKWKILLNCETDTSFAYGPTGGSRKIGKRASKLGMSNNFAYLG